MNQKCLAIGVSTVMSVEGVEAHFPPLDGAIIAAETIGRWALCAGMGNDDVVVLTDRNGAQVTDISIQTTLDTLLPVGSLTDHLILFFAGHGQTGLTDDITYWLLSDSIVRNYQIFVEDLRRQLYFYGIRHLTIFSDACRTLATSPVLRNLNPRPGITPRPGRPDPMIQVARYNACQDASEAFMVRDPKSGLPGKCIFSGVLTEALWGRVPTAFEGDIVDSASLGRGLSRAVSDRARLYNLTATSNGYPFFDKIVFFDKTSPPSPPDPELTPWPTPASIIPASPAEMENVDTAVELVNKLARDGAFRTKILGSNFGQDNRYAPSGGGLAVPKSAAPLIENVVRTRKHLNKRKLTPEERRGRETQLVSQLSEVEALATREARRKAAKRVQFALRHDDIGPTAQAADLIIHAPVRQIWSNETVERVDRSHYALGSGPGQMLVEFADGLVAPIVRYPGLACQIVRDSEGVTGLAYRPQSGGKDNGAAVARDAIAKMISGTLSARSVDKMATKLRYEKHSNPVFGTIAAYCYDVIGDVSAIRRMAAFYGYNGQAAPFDIVFLGLIESHANLADVPAVAEDFHRPLESPIWLRTATARTEVAIAGRCPWLRQGWDYLLSPEDADQPMVGDLLRLRARLTAAPFTTLRLDRAGVLAEEWGLTSWL